MKTKSEAQGFWERIDERLAMRGMTLAEVCRQQGINYDSIISSKMRGAYPGTLTTHKIAKALRTSIESLLENAADNLYARMESLGIQYKTRRLCFHSWRHFFNTRLIASGVQGEITRAVVGHQSADMTDQYLHLRRSDMEVVARVQDELLAVVG